MTASPNNRQEVPSQGTIKEELERAGIVLSDTALQMLHERIKETLTDGGLYVLHDLTGNRGINLTLLSSTDCVISTSRFYRPSCKTVKQRLPSMEWLHQLCNPYKRWFGVKQQRHLHGLIENHLKDGGQWEAKLCNGSIEICFYDMFNDTVMVQKINNPI